jgi:hypothetical protein
MTNAQKFFVILFSLWKNKVQYQKAESILSKSFILSNRINLNNESDYIEKVDIDQEINSITSISDLFRISSILGGITGGSIEFDYMTPFGNFGIPKFAGPNDIDFILDFWYTEPDIFNRDNEYREMILQITNDLENLQFYKYKSRSKNPSFRLNIAIWSYQNLCPISSQIILHIENKLGKPNFETKIQVIIERLNFQNKTKLPLDLALAIYKYTENQASFVWPEKIVDRELFRLFDDYYKN